MTTTPHRHPPLLTERFDVHPSIVGRVNALLLREGLTPTPNHVTQILALHSRKGLNLDLRTALSVSLLLRAVGTCGMQALSLTHPVLIGMVIDLGRAITRHSEPLGTYDPDAEMRAVIDLARTTDLLRTGDDPIDFGAPASCDDAAEPAAPTPASPTPVNTWSEIDTSNDLSLPTESPVASATLVDSWRGGDTTPDELTPVPVTLPTPDTLQEAQDLPTADLVPALVEHPSAPVHAAHRDDAGPLAGVSIDAITNQTFTAFPGAAAPCINTALAAGTHTAHSPCVTTHPAFQRDGGGTAGTAVPGTPALPDDSVPVGPALASALGVSHQVMEPWPHPVASGEVSTAGVMSEGDPGAPSCPADRTADASVVTQVTEAADGELLPSGLGTDDLLPWVAEHREATLSEITAYLAEHQDAEGVFVCLEALQPYRLYMVELEKYYRAYPELLAAADLAVVREAARAAQEVLLTLGTLDEEDFALLAEARLILEPASRLLT